MHYRDAKNAQRAERLGFEPIVPAAIAVAKGLLSMMSLVAEVNQARELRIPTQPWKSSSHPNYLSLVVAGVAGPAGQFEQPR